MKVQKMSTNGAMKTYGAQRGCDVESCLVMGSLCQKDVALHLRTDLGLGPRQRLASGKSSATVYRRIAWHRP